MSSLSSQIETITADEWISKESEYLKELTLMPSLSQIPLLNSNALHNLVDGTLVRFRGMVQDMHNPEFYFEHFEIMNTVTNETIKKSGKYRDTSNIGESEKVNYSSNMNCGQRQTMVVISMPGFNDWAQAAQDKDNTLPHLQNFANTSKRVSCDSSMANLKRSLEEDSDMEVTESEDKQKSKEQKTEEKENRDGLVVSKEHILNFPLPDMQSMSCIVKTYDEKADLKLNDMIEVVGFLSVDPSLSGEFNKETSAIECDEAMEAENITHNPPPSLVPRVHAVWVQKLEHCNPLVKGPFDEDSVLMGSESARQHLKKALTELLLGDDLAAEYLICHLISNVYLRQDSLSLGQFSLNISNIPTQKRPNYTAQLYNIIKQFVTKSYYLPMTLDNMNTMTFLPKKDYDCNRLTSGVLQLSKGTHLMLDETRLEQGRLDGTGVANVTALGHLIQSQRVEYDFKFYKMEFDSDVPVLVLSEGKSLLPCDIHLPLRIEESSLDIFDQIVEAATYYLKEEIMNDIRRYLTNIKRVPFTINEDLQFVQDDFIAMRNRTDGLEPATADDLHRLLVLARLLSLSRGLNVLTKEIWDATKQMEDERLNRVKSRIAK